MADVNKSDNMNQGLPNETGLDAGTRAALERQLNGGNDGIAVGSFADLQRGTVDTPPIEGPFNPNQENTENLVTPAEADAQMAVETVETQREGLAVAGSEDTDTDYESMTKDELQALAEERGVATSGTKAEIIERLQGA